jgi:hypothetical protein
LIAVYRLTDTHRFYRCKKDRRENVGREQYGPIGALLIPALLLAVESIVLTYVLNVGLETEDIRGCFVAGVIAATIVVGIGML